MNVRRNFLILVTLAVAAATPGLGQAAPSTASIPDFSGVWAHPSLPASSPWRRVPPR